jgi:hypothetical protein
MQEGSDGPRPPLDRIMRPRRLGSIRTVWPLEDKDFTPWLAKHLDLLSEVLEIELSTDGIERSVEHPVPGTARSLDILASAFGSLVAVENQYDQLNHDHLTRGLAYAVKLEAAALVVIAERHLDEFRAVAEYLNRCAETLDSGGIRVYLVEVSVEEVGEYYVPRFVIVEKPNPWLLEGVVSRPGVLASVEDFLTRLGDNRREVFGSMIKAWTVAGGRVGLAPKAAALYRSNPAKSGAGETAVFTLYVSGWCSLNRGYLIESGAFPDDNDVGELDVTLDACFSGNERATKPYFTTIPIPTVEGTREFITWLDQWLGAEKWGNA